MKKFLLLLLVLSLVLLRTKAQQVPCDPGGAVNCYYSTDPTGFDAIYEDECQGRIRKIPIYNDKSFFVGPAGTGTPFNFRDLGRVYTDSRDGTQGGSQGSRFYWSDPFYRVDGAEVNAALNYIPIYVDGQSTYSIEIINRKTCRASNGSYTNADLLAKRINITIEKPQFINTDAIKTLCSTSSAFEIKDYFQPGISGISFTMNGTTVTKIDPSTLSPGSYTINAYKSYDNGTYNGAFTFTIIEKPRAIITSNAPIDLCEGSSLKLSASFSPTGEQYTYLWSNGQTTREIIVDRPGTYTVTVSNGICSTTSTTLVITGRPRPGTNVTVTGGTTICKGEQTVLTVENAASYLWFKDGVLLPDEKSQSLVVKESGSYNAELTGFNACVSTTAPTVVIVKPNPVPLILVTGETEFCEGGSVILTAQPGGIPSYYSWSDGQSGKSIVVKKSGIYTVTVTNEGGCQAISLPVIINVKPNPTPIITPDGPLEICTGYSVTLTASRGQSYLWNTGQKTQSITTHYPGDFWVKVTNESGCESTSATTKVVVKPLPIAKIAANRSTFLCNGESVTLTASTGDSYLWSTGQTTQSITTSNFGNYYVDITKDGCTSRSAITSVSVYYPTVPTITPNGNIRPCFGEVVTLTSSSGQRYLWSTGQTSREIQVSSSGTYTVTVWDAYGCPMTSESVTINYKPQFTPTITANASTTLCNGNEVTLTATNGAKYLWSNGATTQSIVAKTQGNYTCLVTNSAGCSVETEPINVTVLNRPVPIINASGLTTFCTGGSVTLTISNPEPGANYFWSNGVVGQSITTHVSGTFTVNAIYSNGCTAVSAATKVTVLPITKPSVIASGPLTFCDGGSVVLTILETGDNYSWSDGVVGKSRTITQSGTYIPTITNANGCSQSGNPITVVAYPKPKPIIAVTGQTTICNGSSTTLSVSNPVSNAVYTWSNGQTGNNTIVSTAGNYFVSATYQNGCSEISDPTIITVLPIVKPTVTSSGSLSFCSGGNVTLTINETGDNYSWSDGVTGKSRVVNAPGNYIATITNNNGCSASSDAVSVNVLPAPKPTVALSKLSPLCEGESTTAYITNPIAGANYTWSSGQSGVTAVLSTSGNYSVYVTYQNGCSAVSDPINLIINPLPKPTISASNTTTVCEGNSLTLTINETGSAYRWSTGETTKSIVVSTAGNYTAYLSNQSGCERQSDPILVTVKDNKIASISIFGKTEICEGQSTTLTASQGASWRWSNGATTRSIDVSKSGIYSVEITNASGCVSTSADIQVKVNPIPKPVIAVTGQTTICQGDMVTLTCSQVGTSYRWSNGETTKSITTGTAGLYTVYITNAQGCERESEAVEILVKTNQKQTIIPTGPTTFCQGESVTLSVPQVAGNIYTWSNGSTSNFINVGNSGNYFVTITNSLGCSTTTDPVSITVYPIPKPTIQISGNTEFCEPETVTLTIKETGAAYRWSTGQTTKSITVSSSQTITAFIINSQGCERESDPITITVKANALPIITASGNTTFCEGENITLSTQNVVGYSYTWSNGQTGNNIIVSTPGEYYVKVKNTAGCERLSAITKVVVYPIPKPTIQNSGKTDLCEPETVTLTIKETGAAYRWSTGETTKSITVSSSQTITAFIINSKGCERESDPITITVKSNPIPVLNISGPLTFCAGESVNLSVPLVVGQTYKWSNGDTGNSTEIKTQGSYYLTVTNENGCSRSSEVVTIKILANPKPAITLDKPSIICEDDFITLTSSPATSYYWPGTGFTTQSIRVSKGGTYIVETINALGCKNVSDPVVIIVNKRDKAAITSSGPTTFCEGNNVILKANPGQKSYLWSTGEITEQISVSKSGKYSVIITNLLGCTSQSEVVTVNVLDKPKPTITPVGATEFCSGGSVILKASDGKYFLWNNGEKTNQIIVSKSGSFTVTVTNDLGCSETSAAVNVIVNEPTPLAKIQDLQVCINNGLVNLNNESPKGGKYTGISINENDFNPLVAGIGRHLITYTYINSKGCQSQTQFTIEVAPLTIISPGDDLTVCFNQDPVLLAIPSVPFETQITGTGVQNNKFYPATAGIGTHIINYIFRNPYGCVSTAKRAITVTAVPDVVTVTGTTEGCNYSTIRLSANATIKGNTPLIYEWFKANDLEVPFYTGREIDFMVTKNESVFVRANAGGSTSCTSGFTEVKVRSLNPTGDFYANTTRVPLAGLVRFTANTSGAVTFRWDFGDGTTSTDKDPVHYYYRRGTYTVTLYAYSTTGCILDYTRGNYIIVDGDPIVITPPDNGTTPIKQEIGSDKNLIYPNPIKNGIGKIRLFNRESHSSDAIVEIYTVSGKLLSKDVYSVQPGQNDIPLRNLSSLVSSTYYLFRVQLNNQSFTYKILTL